MTEQDTSTAADLQLEAQPPGTAAAGAELVHTPQHALERPPIIDSLNDRQLALLKAKSPNLSHAELAQAMEVAWAYQLDPYANEIWFTKSQGRGGREGKLLIMVGRDGLRKIAQRNGLEVAGDLVYDKDTFAVEYVATAAEAKGAEEWAQSGKAPFHRVTHARQGVGAQRGTIVGAWCRVWERRTGTERGYFDAGMEEYDRSGSDAYTPWNKQKSAMMLGACERQAIRQATPLGGLLVQGEEGLVADNEAAALTAPDALAGLPPEVTVVVERARRLGHAGLADVATAEMALRGQPEEVITEWLEHAHAELDAMEPPEAEVVDAVPGTEHGAPTNEPPPAAPADADKPAGEDEDAWVARMAAEADAGGEGAPEPVVPPAEALQEMRDKATALLDEADAADANDDQDRAQELRDEASALMAAVEAAGPADDDGQDTLL